MSLEIAMGKYPQIASAIHKFGYNDNLKTTIESIWNQGGLYPWSAFDSGAQVIYAKSASSSDTGILEVQGLDSEGLGVTAQVDLLGTTAVLVPQTFKRIFRAKYVDGASNGLISMHTVSGTGTIVASIEIGLNQTQISLYTIPSNKVGYLLAYSGSVGKGDDAHLRLHTRESNTTSFLMKTESLIYQSAFKQTFTVPLKLSPSTDIDFRASTTSAGSHIVVAFDIVLQQL